MPTSEARPSRRSTRSHEAVLAAADQLLPTVGYTRMTVDAIASLSGVSKATIYRWWPNKAAIVVESLLAGAESDIAFPDTGSLHEDLVEQAARLADALGAYGRAGALMGLLAQAQEDPDLSQALRTGWQEPRRDVGRAVIHRAVERGEVAGDVDVEGLLDALYGAVYLRVLFGHAALDREALQPVVRLVMGGIVKGAP